VTAVLEALEDEAKEIWTKRAGDRRYYSAMNAYDEARTRQRAAQIKPAAWEDLRKEVERLDGELADLRRRRGEAGREREEIERRRRVLPHAALYRRAQEELAALAEVPDFPADAADVLEQVATALAAANTETTLAGAERDRTHDALKLIVLEPRLIDNADDIEALRETKGAVDKSLSDLPRRRADLATRIPRLQELQRELAWPAEEASLVKERLPQRVRVAEVRALLEARSALDATLASAVADETAARQSLGMLQAQLVELPPEKDFGELSAALKFARSLGDIEGVLRNVQRDADRRHAALSQEMAQLLPWSGEVDALRKLILPTDGETATALADAARAEMARADAKRDHQAEINRKSDLELQRLHLVRDDSAVSPQAVHDARQDRDASGVRCAPISQTKTPCLIRLRPRTISSGGPASLTGWPIVASRRLNSLPGSPLCRKKSNTTRSR